MKKLFLLALLFVGCKSNEDKPEYKLKIDFLLSKYEIQQNAIIFESFKVALKRWERAVPIETTISIMGDPNSYTYRPKMILVKLQPLEGTNIGGQNAVGVWVPDENTIYIDTYYWKEQPEKAYNVILHELGHLLGLPHIIADTNDGLSGDIITKNASKYIMYPEMSNINMNSDLSDLEINLVKENLLINLDKIGYARGCKIYETDM